MSGPVGASPVYNRQSQVLAERHPDCRACESYEHMLSQQIVANGVLRLLVMDLKAALRKAGVTYDPYASSLTGMALDRHGTCGWCGAQSLPRTCTREEDPESGLQ